MHRSQEVEASHIDRTAQERVSRHEDDVRALSEVLHDRGYGRDRRDRQSSRRIEDTDVRRERALQLRRSRAGHLGDVRKKYHVVKELLNDGANFETISRELQNYEQAFYKFVNTHEQYLEFEDDETIKGLMIESYENQRDLKYELELSLKKSNIGERDISLEVSGEFGTVKSKKGSRVSSRTNTSSSRRKVEEANLKMKELHQRQEIERQLERTEADFKRRTRDIEQEEQFKKSELERKLEVLKAESELERAVTFLKLEEEENSSRSSGSLKGKRITHESPDLSQLMPFLKPASERFSETNHSNRPPRPAPQAPRNVSPVNHLPRSTVVDASSVPVMDPFPYVSVPPTSFPVHPQFQHSGLGGPNVPFTDPFPRIPFVPPGFPVDHPYRYASIGAPCVQVNQPLPPDLYDVPSVPLARQVDSIPQVRAEAAEFYPDRMQARGLPEERTARDGEAWMKIADAIRQGPTLPKIDLIKFDGDPLEFSEFVTNFKDNIESQVHDDSQRLTRLLAQCSGKAKEAIRSCVSLPVGTRYDAAWKTLKQNFGQPYMVAEAHIKRLRQKQLKKADALSLMEFSRCLVDAQRTLTNLGPSFMNRLNHEDLIIALMNKLPDDNMKRRWANKAGDLIKQNYEVKYTDFSKFVQSTAERLNNRFAEELKCVKQEKQGHKRVNAYAIHRRGDPTLPPRKNFECSLCSGTHGVWRCPIFKAATLTEKQSIVKQQRLCRRCLDKGHFAASCKRKFLCIKKGCGKEHHWLLHPEDKIPTGDVDDQAIRKPDRSE